MIKLLLRILKSSRYKDLSIRLIAALCIIVFFPLLYIFLQDYFYNEKMKKKNFDLQVAHTMETGKRMIDNLISDFETKTIEFTNSRAVLNILNKTNKTEELSELVNLKNELNFYSDSLCCLDSISIFYQQKGLTKSFTQGSFSINKISVEHWNTLVTSMRANGNWQIHQGAWLTEQQKEKDQTMISLIRPVPSIGKELQGLIIVDLDPKALFSTPIYSKLGEELWVLSPDGKRAFETLAGSDVDKDQFYSVYKDLLVSPEFMKTQYNNKDYFVQMKTSERTGWKYLYLVPASHFDTSNQTQALLIMVIIIFVLLSGIYVVIELRRIYRPVQKLLSIFNTNNEIARFQSDNEFTFLVSAVTSLMDKGVALEGQIKASLSITRQSILTEMLTQPSGAHQKRLEILKEYGIVIFPFGFFVSVIRINDYIDFKMKYNSSDQALLRFFITKLGEEISAKQFNIVAVNTNDRDVILIFNLSEPLELERSRLLVFDTLDEIYGHLKKYLPLQINIGIGDFEGDLSTLSRSYEQAKLSLATNVIKDSEHIKPYWLIQETDYNINMNELREKVQRDIHHAFFSGEMEHVSVGLHRLKTNFIEMREYPIILVRHIYLEIIMTICGKINEKSMKLSDAIHITDIYDRINNIETLDRIVQYTESLLEEWISNPELWVNNEEPTIVTKIMDYINLNFDKEISLNGITTQLGLDPSYVSRLFKQEVGTNFMEYLLTLRINQAKYLLINSEMTVNEISESVGYNNVHSFIRAFKKYERLTPGNYRETINQRSLDNQKVY